MGRRRDALAGTGAGGDPTALTHAALRRAARRATLTIRWRGRAAAGPSEGAAVTQEQRSVQERPIGVSLISTLSLAWGAMAMVEALTLFPSSASSTVVDQGLDTGPVGHTLAFAMVAVGVFCILVSFGLWDMHRWAYRLTLAVAILHVAASVVGVLLGGPTWSMAVAASIVPVVLVVYMLTPGVRRAFRI